MSSIPGYSLEDYVAWNYDVVVEDSIKEVNFSLGVAEMLGTIPARPRLTPEQFMVILDRFEPYREKIEEKLIDYNEEEHGSWRTYCSFPFDCAMTESERETADRCEYQSATS